MPEILFYVLEEGDAGARTDLARRIARKAWQQGHRVYLHAADAENARRLDHLLWEHPREEFFPHALADAPEADASAVLIGHSNPPARHDDVLINLAPQAPAFCGGFRRVAEPVSADDNDRQQARRRWRYYREQGWPVRNYPLRG